MPRPNFPSPYCAMPTQCISRIREEQAYYDRDPERAEREQAAHLAAREEEERQQYEAWLAEAESAAQLQEDIESHQNEQLRGLR